MKTLPIALSLSAVLSLLAGCQNSTAVVGTPRCLDEGLFAPDLTVIRDCQTTSFNRVRLPVTILVFEDRPGNDCASTDPRLESLAMNFPYIPVGVMQVNRPLGGCSRTGCELLCERSNVDVRVLCDASGIASAAFRSPPSGTVYLIDKNNQVIRIASLDDHAAMCELVDKAYDRGWEIYQWHLGSWSE